MPSSFSLCRPQVKLATTTSKRTKRRKRGKRKTLYDQYLADSCSDESTGVGKDTSDIPNTYEFEDFEPGMDINILIQQTVQNIVQSISLEDYDGLSNFGDSDLICFSAALRHNSSILSLQIRYLDVSDVSLVPLCRALEGHASIRALDLSGTMGGSATVRAVFQLVCKNPNILFVRLDDTMVSPHDAEDIRVATLYNALACPDPSSNPFYLGLLRKMNDIEEEKQRYQKQLSTQLWLFSDKFRLNEHSTKEKKVVFTEKASESRIGAGVCAQFMRGRCAYGSRCRYVHPDKTTALKNAIALSQYRMAPIQDDDTVSVGTNTASLGNGGKTRLQSRLRAPNFRMGNIQRMACVTNYGKAEAKIGVDGENTANAVSVRVVWMFTAVALFCSSVLIAAY